MSVCWSVEWFVSWSVVISSKGVRLHALSENKTSTQRTPQTLTRTNTITYENNKHTHIHTHTLVLQRRYLRPSSSLLSIWVWREEIDDCIWVLSRLAFYAKDKHYFRPSLLLSLSLPHKHTHSLSLFLSLALYLSFTLSLHHHFAFTAEEGINDDDMNALNAKFMSWMSLTFDSVSPAF